MSSCVNWELVDAGFGLAEEVAVEEDGAEVSSLLEGELVMKGQKKLIPSCHFRLRLHNVGVISLPEHQ